MIYLNQQLIGTRDAQTIVDQLKSIDVEHELVTLRLFTHRLASDSQFQEIVEASSVRQSSKRVLRKFLFGAFAIGDVLDLEEQTLRATLRVFQKRDVPLHPDSVTLLVKVTFFLFVTLNI